MKGSNHMWGERINSFVVYKNPPTFGVKGSSNGNAINKATYHQGLLSKVLGPKVNSKYPGVNPEPERRWSRACERIMPYVRWDFLFLFKQLRGEQDFMSTVWSTQVITGVLQLGK